MKRKGNENKGSSKHKINSDCWRKGKREGGMKGITQPAYRQPLECPENVSIGGL